jgi:high-affinity nickel permease
MTLELLPLALAASLGFRHAFEADHLVAVGNIVTRRNSPIVAMRDGTSWGVGHSLSILTIGLVMILLKGVIPEKFFNQMEGAVGLMIILLGVFRLWQYFKKTQLKVHAHLHEHDGQEHKHVHVHTLAHDTHDHLHLHKVSFGVGLLHGVAGSGILIAAVMASMKSMGGSILFLVIFNIGCIVGMMLAATALSLPFSKKLNSYVRVQEVLVIVS